MLLIAVAVGLAPGALAQDHTKILLVGKDPDHPPRTHEYMFECRLLAKCLEQTNGVETVVSKGWPSDPGIARDIDVIVLYTGMGGNVLSDAKVRDQVEALLKRGTGLVMIHWSTGADDGHPGQWLLENLGGWFGFSFSKFPVRDSVVHQLDPAHAISRGWKDYPMHDEYYTGLKFHKNAQPLWTAKVDDQDVTIAWTFDRPGSNDGRSFGTVCGHFHECFGNESFRRSLINAILWAAHREVPAEGAPCRVTDDDLKLPPDPRDGEKK
jgi:type 1 glutamine amidotransferase